MLKRYAVKLLFQYRCETNGISNARRTVEDRIILLRAKTARLANTMAIEQGKSSEFTYKNNSDGLVHFEFVGVTDILHLGIECEKNEVWYDIREMLRPSERASSIIPPVEKLNAVYWEEDQGSSND